MKKCPFCAEEIQDEAIKCKHCGSNITLQENLKPIEQSSFNQINDTNWAMLAHLGGLIPVACLSLIVPLLIFMIKGNESDFVLTQSREALNFQITLMIFEFIAVLIAFTVIGIPITVLAFIFFWLTNLICSIKGAIRTSNGKAYQYPFNLRLIK